MCCDSPDKDSNGMQPDETNTSTIEEKVHVMCNEDAEKLYMLQTWIFQYGLQKSRKVDNTDAPNEAHLYYSDEEIHIHPVL